MIGDFKRIKVHRNNFPHQPSDVNMRCAEEGVRQGSAKSVEESNYSQGRGKDELLKRKAKMQKAMQAMPTRK